MCAVLWAGPDQLRRYHDLCTTQSDADPTCGRQPGDGQLGRSRCGQPKLGELRGKVPVSNRSSDLCRRELLNNLKFRTVAALRRFQRQIQAAIANHDAMSI
ncbi:hypothetical protein Bbelb_442540 [Branchiostoma belcheri]|nr:hypothetical protein Bbelb_442540 [Branchiostoma belcheri]